jgi:hypothetical protein
LVALFAIADKRRRDTICHNRCNHEWHNIVDLQRSAPGDLEKHVRSKDCIGRDDRNRE